MLEVLQSRWDEILQTMKNEFEITELSFKTWILPLKVYSVKDDLITIIVPEQKTANYVEKKYGTQLKVTIGEMMDHEYEIRFVSAADASSDSVIPTKPVHTPDEDIKKAGLNPKYTFETFVVGGNNSFAHAAALAVAESPGEMESYNPLFIYGGVGLGKTHLMQAIGNYIIRNNPSLKVMYVTSEVFTNELIESIKNDRNNSNTSFREKYRNVDVLMIDDIQFIIGKERTQEEFFHTFNTLKESKKQIIISSDRAPKNFEALEERLRSRFEWGLMLDISPPDYETRMAILHKKEEMEGYNVDNDVMDYIATNVKSNIRELEGALTKLVAFSKLTHNDITLQFAEEVLKDIISPNAHREVTPELIIKVVAEHFNISSEDIISKKRNKEIAHPRQIAMYLCRNLTDLPLLSIGNSMGMRDHATVSYGIQQVSDELKDNENLRSVIDAIMKKINPS